MGCILANDLSSIGHDVCVIDRKKDNLSILGSGFNGHIINGIEFDRDNLKDASIEKADVLLAVTPSDNINITVSMIANNIFNVPTVIARVNDPKREHIYESLDIKTVCPSKLGVELLTSRINAKNFNLLANLDNDHEVIEVLIENDIQPTQIQAVEQKFFCIISALAHDNLTVLPRKDALIAKGDKITCTIHKNYRDKLLKFFIKEMSIWIP